MNRDAEDAEASVREHAVFMAVSWKCIRVYNGVERRGQNMGYCAICGRHHETDVSCSDGGGQALRDSGVDNRSHVYGTEFGRIAKLADNWMVNALIVLLGIIAAFMILTAILERKAF